MKEGLNDARSPPAEIAQDGRFVSTATASSSITWEQMQQALHDLTKLDSHVVFLRGNQSRKSRDNWLEGEEEVFHDIDELVWNLQNGKQEATVNSEEVFKILTGLHEFIKEAPLDKRTPQLIENYLKQGKHALAEALSGSKDLKSKFDTKKKELEIDTRRANRLIHKLGGQIEAVKEEVGGLTKKVEGVEKKVEGVEKKVAIKSRERGLIDEKMEELKRIHPDMDPNELQARAIELLEKEGKLNIRNCFCTLIPNEALREMFEKEIEKIKRELNKTGKELNGRIIKETYNRVLAQMVEERIITAEEAEKLGPLIFFRVTLKEAGKLIKAEKEPKHFWIIHSTETGENHAVWVLSMRMNRGKIYVKIIEENIDGNRAVIRETELSEFANDSGEIIIFANEKYRAIFSQKLDDEETDMIKEFKYRGGDSGGNGGTADGQGGGSTDGQGGGAQGGTGAGNQGGGGSTGGALTGGGTTGQGGGTGASSALGGTAGADDIPRNIPKAMATTLPENNSVITGDNIGRGNNGQTSSAATPDNILNLNLPSEQHIGINDKGIAASPVINTGTGLAPPGKAINTFFASLNTPTSEQAHTLAAVSSGINSRPVSEPTRDDSDSSAPVFPQQTQGIKGSRIKY